MQKIFWLITGFLLSAEQAFAACTPATGASGSGATGASGSGLTKLPNPIKSGTFQDLACDVLGVVSKIGGIIAVFFIIYAGFLFVTASGKDEKLKDAKKAILYAVIGTAILLGAEALSKILETTINSLQ